MDAGLWREILLNSSIVLLVSSFFIGMATGQNGLDEIGPFIVVPFKGVLCRLLQDMGLGASRGSRQVVCIVRPERLDGLLKAALKVVGRHKVVVTVRNFYALHSERF